MKKTMMILVAAALFAGSVPVMAAEQGAVKTSQMDEQCRKDCDMLIRNCGQEVDSIQQRIQKLQHAIKSNASTYTREQLNKLKDSLENAQRTLSNIERGGA